MCIGIRLNHWLICRDKTFEQQKIVLILDFPFLDRKKFSSLLLIVNNYHLERDTAIIEFDNFFYQKIVQILIPDVTLQN